MKKNIIIVRGGGDIATGTIYKLHQSGYPVLVTEIANPSAIRRQVAFSEAVYEKSYTVEGVTCYFAENLTRAYELLKQRKVALMIDPDGAVIREVKPAAVVDGILAKKNLGTVMDMAPFTVALGPGAIAGVAKERVIHAECAGVLYGEKKISDYVQKDEVIAYIYPDAQAKDASGQREKDGAVAVKATISGILRGLIRDGYPVTKGFKIADIDPRESEYENCFTISDKARCIAGGVLEALLHAGVLPE